MCAGAQALGHSSVAFPRPWQGSGWDVEQPGHETTPVQDAGVKVSHFTCYTTRPNLDPSFVNVVPN